MPGDVTESMKHRWIGKSRAKQAERERQQNTGWNDCLAELRKTGELFKFNLGEKVWIIRGAGPHPAGNGHLRKLFIVDSKRKILDYRKQGSDEPWEYDFVWDGSVGVDSSVALGWTPEEYVYKLKAEAKAECRRLNQKGQVHDE